MKTETKVLVTLVFALTIAARCDEGDSERAEPSAASTTAAEKSAAVKSDTGARESLLSELASRLDQVQTAKPGDRVITGGDIDLGPLVGMTQAEIRTALGAPRACHEKEVTDDQGRQLPVAPCESADDWFYSFYHLPEGWLGGGPELLLRFDGKVCKSAEWKTTR